jgi:hypothetical protein
LDGNIDIREESRRKRHLDIAESLASCCYLIHELQARPRRYRRKLADVEGQKTVRGLLESRSRLVSRSRIGSIGED